MSTSQPIKKSSTIFPYRGKWRIQYFDHEGRIRTKTVESKQDAYKHLTILEQLVTSGALPRKPTEIPYFKEWIGQWFESRRTEVRPVTLWGFESTIRLHLLPSLGGKRLNQISPRTLEHFYQHLMLNKGLSEATVQKAHSIVSHALEMATRYGFIDSNPCRFTKTPQTKATKLTILSAPQIAAALREASKLGKLSEFRWLLALRYGLRQGECLALEWTDLDLESRSIHVTKTVNSIPGAGFVVTPPKSELSVRDIPIDEKTYSLLVDLKSEIANGSGNGLIFQSATGGHVDAKTDYDRWQRLLKSSGLPPMKLHAARHSAATLLLSSGANLRSIQLLLGHSSPSFTMATYLHPNQEDLRMAIEGTVKVLSDVGTSPLEIL
jgi:integrase